MKLLGCSLPSYLVHACSIFSWLPAERFCRLKLLARRQGIGTRERLLLEMVRLVALRSYDRESASAPGCMLDGTGTLYRLFSVT